ncbi:hypothetical protein BGX27_000933 [Mortierella sp. AM989]|nr:hypothetical protein BGX27_000933 [Mortierella sp. AM989]
MDYQTQGQTQAQSQAHTVTRQQSPTNSGYGGYRVSEDHQGAPGTLLSDEQGYAAVHSYHNSPTLSNNQTLLTRAQAAPAGSGGGSTVGAPGGSSQPSSPFQVYQPIQQQLYSPYQPNSHIQMQDHRIDPYRSAYSQQQQHQMQQQGTFSPYHESSMPLEELNQMNYSSRYSLSSSNNGISMAGGGGNGQKYPMRALHSQDSNQALSASFHQQLHSQAGTTPPSSEFGGGRSDRYQDLDDGSLVGATTRQSSAMQHQYSLTDSNPSGGRNTRNGDEEEDENAEILQKVSGSPSSMSGYSSKAGGKNSKNKLKNKFSSADDSEEEGQERGELRQRDRKRCWCCSRRLCVYITFLILICLGVMLYFVLPRSPAFSFVSVESMGDPVVTNNQIQEPFLLKMRVDSSDSYVPIRFTTLEMTMWMKIDHTKIGSNDNLPSSFDIKPRTIQVIAVPMMMDYTSLKIDTNADGTLQELITACKPVDPSSGAIVPGINLTFGGKMFVWGLSWCTLSCECEGANNDRAIATATSLGNRSRSRRQYDDKCNPTNIYSLDNPDSKRTTIANWGSLNKLYSSDPYTYPTCLRRHCV